MTFETKPYKIVQLRIKILQSVIEDFSLKSRGRDFYANLILKLAPFLKQLYYIFIDHLARQSCVGGFKAGSVNNKTREIEK